MIHNGNTDSLSLPNLGLKQFAHGTGVLLVKVLSYSNFS